MSLLVDIKKDFGRFKLDAHFEAESGSVTGLLGASGCGKSVTLKCVAGIEKPDEGRIVLDGRVLFDSEKRIDLTPQQRRVESSRLRRMVSWKKVLPPSMMMSPLSRRCV